jgi:GT2 family glycosyltransferase
MYVCIVDDGSSAPSLIDALPDQDTGYIIDKYKFPFHYIYRVRHPQNLARVYSSRNLAAKITEGGEYILQLDDDVEFSPYLLNLLQSTAGIVKEEHWVWTPRISNNIDVDKNGHCVEQNWDRGTDGRWYDGRVSWQESHWGSADSSGMFMPRRTWDAIGGYDLDYDTCMGAGDQDLALRVQMLGAKPGDVKLWIAPYFVNKADEEGGSLRMEMIHRATRLGRERNEDIFYRKHHPRAWYDNGAKGEWTNV